jgi:hypothetical protein
MQKLVSAFALRLLLGVFCVPLVGAATGCHVHHSRHDNGLHRGHYKQNPGKKRGHHKKHKKGRVHRGGAKGPAKGSARAASRSPAKSPAKSSAKGRH